MSQSFHVAISVDIDRFGDRYIERNYLDMFREQHGCKTARDVRKMCEAARLEGREVFPPCDNLNPNGSCAGHDGTKP